MPLKSPFESVAKSGQGKVVLSLLPPSVPAFSTITYKYPLKLLTHSPGFVPESSALPCASPPVHLYILTYGGGLLPGDHIDVSITLNPQTRLVVTTPQGSTKIFRTEPHGHRRDSLGTPAAELSDMSRQTLDVRIGREAALCYLPDPCVPFKDSRYEQVQTFTVDEAAKSSLCVLDWVTQGRTARGEHWDFHLWRGKNEVWSVDETTGDKKLLHRDSLILEDENGEGLIRERTTPHGIVGTLILYGPLFDSLASFLVQRFASQPRIGAPSSTSSSSPNLDSNVTWIVARVRAGFVLVKFGAKDHEAAKQWLGGLLRKEGSVEREFGHEALRCL